MNKLIPLALSVAVLGGLFALPVSAQISPVNQCTLTDNMDIKGVTVLKDSNIASGGFSITQLDAGADPAFPNSTNGTLNDNIEGGVGLPVPTSDWGSICLVNTINRIVDWLFFIMLTVAFALIVIAAFIWVTSGGDAAKQQTARNIIIAAMVGLVIAIFARILPAVVLGIVT